MHAHAERVHGVKRDTTCKGPSIGAACKEPSSPQGNSEALSETLTTVSELDPRNHVCPRFAAAVSQAGCPTGRPEALPCQVCRFETHSKTPQRCDYGSSSNRGKPRQQQQRKGKLIAAVAAGVSQQTLPCTAAFNC